MKRAWTTSEVRQLHEMRSRRLTAAAIGLALGRTENAIYNFLRYVPATKDAAAKTKPIDRLPPIEKPARPDCDWKPEEIATLLEMAEDGSTAKDVAEALGRTNSAVRCKASHLGIRFRNRGRFSIYRLEQEENHYRQNAIEGSALLRDRILAVISSERLAA